MSDVKLSTVTGTTPAVDCTYLAAKSIPKAKALLIFQPSANLPWLGDFAVQPAWINNHYTHHASLARTGTHPAPLARTLARTMHAPRITCTHPQNDDGSELGPVDTHALARTTLRICTHQARTTHRLHGKMVGGNGYMYIIVGLKGGVTQARIYAEPISSVPRLTFNEAVSFVGANRGVGYKVVHELYECNGNIKGVWWVGSEKFTGTTRLKAYLIEVRQRELVVAENSDLLAVTWTSKMEEDLIH
ncbi:hypothetical protein BDP27DRAFT_1373785 [Rhodocollybia butyracea]|uniref:Uncharacterized protein n=1 Tax=Rhodocollybia butyracea TaxID=206335 RepID=A0A9P5P8E7_9AGAR|nr:hypothetical protein BDP27DRAFT_1373785 [Rhodocollybia butyracea]